MWDAGAVVSNAEVARAAFWHLAGIVGVAAGIALVLCAAWYHSEWRRRRRARDVWSYKRARRRA